MSVKINRWRNRMEKKRNVWEKSRQGVQSFLIALIVLFTLTPAVHAEDRELIEEE